MKTLFNRRDFISGSAGTMVGGSLLGTDSVAAGKPINLRLATFRFDVTPPKGHSLCGGWIRPVAGVDDPLEAIGYIILGIGKPIVVCAVDWTGLANSAHIQWREALANAAKTTIDRVAVQCVHQHNAPFACMDAQAIVQEQGDLPNIVTPDFFTRCLKNARDAVAKSMKKTTPVTHVAQGEARVEKVAANRRIIGLNGKLISQRGSSSRKPEHHRFPEGLIDPMLKTVAFYNGSKKLVASHFYACHPMSYYGDGRVSADFCGLARRRMQKQEPNCVHLYFNGCGGNIGAGKYNNGSKEARVKLTQRMVNGIAAASATLNPQPIRSLVWESENILPPLDPRFNEAQLMASIQNKANRVVARNRPAYTVAFIRRVKKGVPITLSAMHINDISLLHLPAESFIEYQLRAQAIAPNRFVACAAYGDGGPWYIPVKEAYPQGGYAVGVAWCSPAMDPLMSSGIQTLLSRAE
tara:strand:- start:61 stop:1458 length:1398 start_codon:yes stop_codon:yes gene_type:complete